MTTAQNAPIIASLGSSTVTTTVTLSPSSALFQLLGKATEVSGISERFVSDSRDISCGPHRNSGGEWNWFSEFCSGQTGDGVYFLNCCTNANQAYYKFTGSAISNIFNMNHGKISFTLQSRYSFAQRQATPQLRAMPSTYATATEPIFFTS